MSLDNTLLDLHNTSDDTEAEFDNCFIFHSKQFLNKLTAVNVEFISTVHVYPEELFRSANILQISDAVRRVVFLLFLLF